MPEQTEQQDGGVAQLPVCPRCFSDEQVSVSPPESSNRGTYFCPCNSPDITNPTGSGHFTPNALTVAPTLLESPWRVGVDYTEQGLITWVEDSSDRTVVIISTGNHAEIGARIVADHNALLEARKGAR